MVHQYRRREHWLNQSPSIPFLSRNSFVTLWEELALPPLCCCCFYLLCVCSSSSSFIMSLRRASRNNTVVHRVCSSRKERNKIFYVRTVHDSQKKTGKSKGCPVPFSACVFRMPVCPILSRCSTHQYILRHTRLKLRAGRFLCCCRHFAKLKRKWSEKSVVV